MVDTIGLVQRKCWTDLTETPSQKALAECNSTSALRCAFPLESVIEARCVLYLVVAALARNTCPVEAFELIIILR